jgi:hypothetical protein
MERIGVVQPQGPRFQLAGKPVLGPSNSSEQSGI